MPGPLIQLDRDGELSRLALGVREINEWSTGSGDADDPMLIEEIRTKVLPRRGISAQPDEILITVGAEQALHLVTELLVDATTVCAMEEPGNSDLRDLLTRAGAEISLQPLDEHGLIVDQRLDHCALAYVTPSYHQMVRCRPHAGGFGSDTQEAFRLM